MAARLRPRSVVPASRHVPYAALIEPNVVRSVQGDLIQTLRLSGASFESTDDEVINRWHEQLNALWRNIASPQLALWAHVIRRREREYPEGQCAPGFAAELESAYRQRLAGETLMVNDLYLSLVFRPHPGRAGSALASLFGQVSPEVERTGLTEALEACGKLRGQLTAALAEYDPEWLGVEQGPERPWSALLGFLGLLINGESSRWPLPMAPLHDVLPVARPYFGAESLELRLPTATRVGAMLGIKEYPTPTVPGFFNRLLTAPFPFVLTQSFTCLAKSTAQGLLSRQYHRLVNAGDLAISQAESLKGALDQLAGNEFVMGDHHCSLLVWSEPCEAGQTPRLQVLNESVALARGWLGETGMVVAREDLALESAYWAQLPGNFSHRPRKAPITSRNFAGLVPFHNFPTGRAAGNHWGPAVALLRTRARSPFYFSLHASDPKDASGGSRRDTGHTFICGPTGSGKTVLVGFLLSMLTRFGATQIVFDKDRGLEILVRALGGEYLTLKRGRPTGCNPLALPRSAANDAFVRDWLTRLVTGERPLSARQQAELLAALAGTWALSPGARRLSCVLEFLDPTEADGPAARLKRWCGDVGGDLAWAFDQAEDRVAPLLIGRSLLGIDVTEFLNDATVRGPLTQYLFHVLAQLLDGRRLVVWMDEFSRLLADPAFEGLARDGLKTWRKLNAVAVFATQSPSDVLDSPIARTLIEQTPTKVFFPNGEARRSDYCEGFGLSIREFALVRGEMPPGTRQFLVKQGPHSTVCELDLQGFDVALKVLSGRATSVQRLEALIAACGPDPATWLGAFAEMKVE